MVPLGPPPPAACLLPAGPGGLDVGETEGSCPHPTLQLQTGTSHAPLILRKRTHAYGEARGLGAE